MNMRDIMTIINEAIDPRSDEDNEDQYQDEESKYDSYKSSRDIAQHKVSICLAAQKVYDAWDQSDEYDEHNGGGICHVIADEVCSILGSAGILCTTVSATHEQHVYVVAQCSDGVFEIDIPYRIYETGGGFTWHKIPNVKFEPDDVVIERLDYNPAKMNQYVEEWDEGED